MNKSSFLRYPSTGIYKFPEGVIVETALKKYKVNVKDSDGSWENIDDVWRSVTTEPIDALSPNIRSHWLVKILTSEKVEPIVPRNIPVTEIDAFRDSKIKLNPEILNCVRFHDFALVIMTETCVTLDLSQLSKETGDIPTDQASTVSEERSQRPHLDALVTSATDYLKNASMIPGAFALRIDRHGIVDYSLEEFIQSEIYESSLEQSDVSEIQPRKSVSDSLLDRIKDDSAQLIQAPVRSALLLSRTQGLKSYGFSFADFETAAYNAYREYLRTLWSERAAQERSNFLGIGLGDTIELAKVDALHQAVTRVVKDKLANNQLSIKESPLGSWDIPELELSICHFELLVETPIGELTALIGTLQDKGTRFVTEISVSDEYSIPQSVCRLRDRILGRYANGLIDESKEDLLCPDLSGEKIVLKSSDLAFGLVSPSMLGSAGLRVCILQNNSLRMD